MHVSCSSHTWFIYNLNTILLLATFTQQHDTYVQVDDLSTSRNPLTTPLDNSPCIQVPLTYLESLLSVWRNPCPPWSQVACKLTSPSPFPFPAPNGSPIKLCALLRRHHDTDFTQFGTTVTLNVKKLCLCTSMRTF